MDKVTRSTKRKFVNDGVFKAEVSQLLQRGLADFGFSGLEINFTRTSTEIRVLISKFTELMDPNKQSGIKLKELKGLIEQRFNLVNNSEHKLTLVAKQTNHKGVNAQEQAEYLKKRFLLGVPVRTAAMSVIRAMCNKGAKGVEIIVSGKLRQQRAKSVKYKGGYLIHTGNARRVFLDIAVRHIFLRQGIMGVKVKIMMPYNPLASQGKGFGISTPLPDVISFVEEKTKDEGYY